MLQGMKIRLHPTPEQEILFRKSAGVARWTYNYALTRQRETYLEQKQSGVEKPKSISVGDIRKELTQLKKTEEFSWLAEVGSNVIKQSARDYETAVRKMFKGLAKFPKPKTKRKSKISFYVNYESLKRKNHGFIGEKLGFVKTSTNSPKLSKGQKYYNPRITFDGKYWFLSFTYEVKEPQRTTLTDSVIGIDLGIRNLVTMSDNMVVENINKSDKVRRFKKRLRRKERSLSRKIKANISHYEEDERGYYKPIYIRPLNQCKNIQKAKKEIQLLYRNLKYIRLNHIHQTTNALTKTKPKAIVLEDLNVRGMMKNRHLAQAIQECMFCEFRRQLEYKIKRYGTELIIADRFYPSSKRCSYCGNIKKKLKLKDRVYRCDKCGLEKDRDLNAAENLAYYYYSY